MADIHTLDDRALRKRIGEILVKWDMPTRQAAISEIMQEFRSVWSAGLAAGIKRALVAVDEPEPEKDITTLSGMRRDDELIKIGKNMKVKVLKWVLEEEL